MGIAVLFRDTAIGVVSEISLVFIVIAIMGRLFVPPQELLNPNSDVGKLWKIGKKVLLVAVDIALFVIMIRFWPSVGSCMILSYLVIPLFRGVLYGLRRILMREYDDPDSQETEEEE